MRVLTNSLRFIIAASVLCFFGFTQARAETPLIEFLKANPEWFGTVNTTNSLTVTFHFSGNPPKLGNVSYRWDSEQKRDSIEFKLGEKNIEFLIPPRDRNRWYKLDLTNDGALIGTLTGLEKDKELTFSNFVLLRPVVQAAGAPVELRGSAKHCSLPPDFKVSAGEGLPPELKKFLGYFSGDWLTRRGSRGAPHTLLVAGINKDGTVVAYYALDKSPLNPASKPGCWKFATAKIENGALKATFTNGTDLKYEFTNPDTLSGHYASGRSSGTGYFTRDIGSPSQRIAQAEQTPQTRQESERPPQTLAQSAQSDEAARKAGEEKARRAEITRREQEAEEVRKAEEEKARRLELAGREREAEEARKVREAEAEKARRAEVARRQREAEEARKAEEAEKARARVAELERGRQQAEEKFWNSVKESQDLKEVHEYLDRYPQGRFVTEARAWVAVLEKIRDAAKNEFGKYFALVIGIANYRYLPKLKTSVNDAKAVAKLLKDDYGFKVTLLIDPSRLEIINALDEYRETLGAKDNLLIYYAGHGWLDKEVDRGYWLPVDAQENRRGQWVSNATVTDTMKGLGAKHVMVVADSCYSGTLIRSAKIGPHKRTEDFWRQMASKWTRVAITSGGLEPVADSGGSGHSPFAKAFIDVLQENDRVMDGTTLFSKMRRPVMLAAEQTPQYADVRQAGHDGGDFLFVRKK